MATLTVIPQTVIACPRCPKCGTRTSLVYVFPNRPGHDQRAYECSCCQHEVIETIQFRKVG